MTGTHAATRTESRNGDSTRREDPSALSRISFNIREGEDSEAGAIRDARYRRGTAAADLVSAAAAVFVSVVLVGDKGDGLEAATILLLPLVIVVGKVIGLYDRDEYVLRKATLEEAPKLFQVATLFTLLLLLTEGAFVDGDLGQAQAAALWALLFGLMIAGRTSARWMAGHVTPAERILVVGDQESASRLTRKGCSTTSANLEVIGRISFGPGRRRGEDQLETNGDGAVPLLGDVEDLGPILLFRDVDRVVIAPGLVQGDLVLDVIRCAKFLGVKVSVLPTLFEVVGSSVEFDDVDGMTVLGLRRYGLSRSSAFLKRSLDVTVALTLLLASLPLLVLIAIAIKIDSPGPVLFRQCRIGKWGRRFQITKFRTMIDGADQQKEALAVLNESDGLFKIADDPRMTRVGRLLRRGSMDEIPQLLNVLRGEMSLVGPRPLVPDEDSRVEGWDRRRLELPPGMTGHWQVLGSARIPLREMVKIDYLYGANWSLWGDLKILLRTVPVVLARRGL